MKLPAFSGRPRAPRTGSTAECHHGPGCRLHSVAARRLLTAFAALLCLSLCSTAPASAQSLNLRDLLTDFLVHGITLAPPSSGIDHSAHFTDEDNSQFVALEQATDEMAEQLSAVPFSTSAGGFAYQFDPSLGAFTRPTQSFGPTYTERAFSLGKKKINLAVSHTHYTFDKLDALNLRNGDLQLLWKHEDTNEDGTDTTYYFEGDVITAKLFVNLETSVTALTATYGVSDKLDVGMAVPVLDVRLDASAEATVQRLATAHNLPDTHSFPNGTAHETIRQGGEAQGLGDITLRGKYRLNSEMAMPMALVGELRLPTGDELNLLGTGAVQGKLALVASVNRAPLAPHLNVGYSMNGKGLPDELSGSLGVDALVDPRITLSAELRGRHESGVRRIETVYDTYFAKTGPNPSAPDSSAVFPRLSTRPDQALNELNGSIGLKMNLGRTFLLTLNGFFPLTKQGLRDSFTPLIGLDYSF